MVAALEREFGGRVVTGALLKDLVSARLGQVEAGVKDWRLLTVEPFHIHGTLRDLAAARELLKDQRVHRPGAGTEDSQPTAAPPPPSPKPAEPPGLTAKASDALASARRGALGVWKDHLDFLDPVLGRALAGLAERGPLATPALSDPVLSSAAALKPAELVRIRKGVLVKHLPLKRALKARGIATVRDASPGFWIRAAAGAISSGNAKRSSGSSRRSAPWPTWGWSIRSALRPCCTTGANWPTRSCPCCGWCGSING